jgi:DNA-binding MurR/RpiR family transcriptional regulator
LAIKHFYRVQADYQNGTAPKERFLEAISCLGVMGNIESSQVLALQLGYYNSRMEYNAEYDTDIMLRLIQALRDIGDKSAFDYLLYISYLNYPEQIQTAAREALNRIRW